MSARTDLRISDSRASVRATSYVVYAFLFGVWSVLISCGWRGLTHSAGAIMRENCERLRRRCGDRTGLMREKDGEGVWGVGVAGAQPHGGELQAACSSGNGRTGRIEGRSGATYESHRSAVSGRTVEVRRKESKTHPKRTDRPNTEAN
ncbi:hypothetical protein BV898_19763 [Hypsibius exemplaris]|uniref:Uncharacterized protein n=1 Tax=Hypsibius exemplaris TaxID=2072580 RepID=A0A9X6NLG7_HYPEX|nr:hypothetical protein BV898_19763 [Hypsibius exemplaris]